MSVNVKGHFTKTENTDDAPYVGEAQRSSAPMPRLQLPCMNTVLAAGQEGQLGFFKATSSCLFCCCDVTKQSKCGSKLRGPWRGASCIQELEKLRV